MIGVIGATGSTGRALVAALKEKGADFRCLVRDTAAAAEKLGGDVEMVQADLADAASLEAGLQGCDKLFLLSGHSPVMVEQQMNAVNAAKAAGVGHIVKLSGGSFITKEASPAMIGRGHWELEEAIKASGLEWTMLRPGFFMQNFLNMAEMIKGMGKVMMPLPADVPLGMIDVRDTADVAANVLTSDGHAGQTYELSGPNVVPAEAVAAIGEAIGKEIAFVTVPMEGAVGAMKERGMPDWLVDHQSTLMGMAANGEMVSYGNDLIAELSGHAPRTPADFARDFAGAFQG
ncbi:MAG: nucleoside-diphosphate sugar epimerase [Alphaproteobacteria bacterium]|nr:nucleoside-diphosphate sugar epimerase [Alphaproteobacteria bacterium]|tara:strand:- start:2586 stop:3452 length:867 start_codon:yes stop_codon:yes gene_type:complete